VSNPSPHTLLDPDILDEKTSRLETERANAMRNHIHSAILLAGIGLLLAISCWMIWGITGVIGTTASIAILYFVAPRLPPKVVMQLYSARLVDHANGGQLIEIAEALAQRGNLSSVPALYIVPSLTLNAFTTGSRGNAAIALTEGLLRRLDLREIAAVLAHEMSHIVNNDLSVMGLADLMSRFLLALSYAAAFLGLLNIFFMLTAGEAFVSWLGIALLYIAPAFSSVLQLRLSRTREYNADRTAVYLTSDPESLASALGKLERYTGQFWEDLMFPVPGRRIPQPSSLRSHPTTEERISRLQHMQMPQDHPPLLITEQPIITLAGVGPIALRPRYRFPGLWY